MSSFGSLRFSGNIYPAAFIGHGSPMNAIEENEYSLAWQELGKVLPEPKAIVVVSAHWQTRGTRITANVQQKTIHDFYGFPDTLYKIQYDAPGSPEIVKKILAQLPEVSADTTWGLDHGTWSILIHLFPGARIPVLQISLNTAFSAQQHYDTGRKLAFLREQGVFLVSSGNLIHNLQMFDWQNTGRKYEWAESMNKQQILAIKEKNTEPLIHYDKSLEQYQRGIPTPEHYLPALYTLGAREPNDQTLIFNNDAISSLSMTSFLFWQ